jgi:hypothetical protein
MKRLITQTRREKIGTIDGINLFFGALLGANLGTTSTLPAFSYAQLTALLVGLVVTIRMVSVSDRRGYAFGTLAAYVAVILAILFVPALGIDGLAEDDLHRLVLTLGIWLGATILVEFLPIRAAAQPGEEA